MLFHVLDDPPLIYVEVPKACSTSIKRWMAERWMKVEPPASAEALHRLVGYRYAEDQGELRRWAESYWPSYNPFTVVRDPVERVESLFYDKVRLGSLDDFAESFAWSRWADDPHGMRQVDLVGRDLGWYDAIGRVENLSPLGRLLGDEIPHEHESRRGPPMSARARAKIVEHFREDFELLGYDPDGSRE